MPPAGLESRAPASVAAYRDNSIVTGAYAACASAGGAARGRLLSVSAESGGVTFGGSPGIALPLEAEAEGGQGRGDAGAVPPEARAVEKACVSETAYTYDGEPFESVGTVGDDDSEPSVNGPARRASASFDVPSQHRANTNDAAAADDASSLHRPRTDDRRPGPPPPLPLLGRHCAVAPAAAPAAAPCGAAQCPAVSPAGAGGRLPLTAACCPEVTVATSDWAGTPPGEHRALQRPSRPAPRGGSMPPRPHSTDDPGAASVPLLAAGGAGARAAASSCCCADTTAATAAAGTGTAAVAAPSRPACGLRANDAVEWAHEGAALPALRQVGADTGPELLPARWPRAAHGTCTRPCATWAARDTCTRLCGDDRSGCVPRRHGPSEPSCPAGADAGAQHQPLLPPPLMPLPPQLSPPPLAFLTPPPLPLQLQLPGAVSCYGIPLPPRGVHNLDLLPDGSAALPGQTWLMTCARERGPGDPPARGEAVSGGCEGGWGRRCERVGRTAGGATVHGFPAVAGVGAGSAQCRADAGGGVGCRESAGGTGGSSGCGGGCDDGGGDSGTAAIDAIASLAVGAERLGAAHAPASGVLLSSSGLAVADAETLRALRLQLRVQLPSGLVLAPLQLPLPLMLTPPPRPPPPRTQPAASVHNRVAQEEERAALAAAPSASHYAAGLGGGPAGLADGRGGGGCTAEGAPSTVARLPPAATRERKRRAGSTSHSGTANSCGPSAASSALGGAVADPSSAGAQEGRATSSQLPRPPMIWWTEPAVLHEPCDGRAPSPPRPPVRLGSQPLSDLASSPRAVGGQLVDIGSLGATARHIDDTRAGGVKRLRAAAALELPPLL